MVKIKQAVFDTGPFIHLNEINRISLLTLFQRILTTNEILTECRRMIDKIKKLKNIEKKELTGKSKDMAKYLVGRYGLDLGEATGIALCNQELIMLFFTDDLEARRVAKNLGFEPHGTIAIILRSFKEKKITKKEAEQLIEDLYSNSSLFLTSDLKDWTFREIERFKR